MEPKGFLAGVPCWSCHICRRRRCPVHEDRHLLTQVWGSYTWMRYERIVLLKRENKPFWQFEAEPVEKFSCGDVWISFPLRRRVKEYAEAMSTRNLTVSMIPGPHSEACSGKPMRHNVWKTAYKASRRYSKTDEKTRNERTSFSTIRTQAISSRSAIRAISASQGIRALCD